MIIIIIITTIIIYHYCLLITIIYIPIIIIIIIQWKAPRLNKTSTLSSVLAETSWIRIWKDPLKFHKKKGVLANFNHQNQAFF